MLLDASSDNNPGRLAVDKEIGNIVNEWDSGVAFTGGGAFRAGLGTDGVTAAAGSSLRATPAASV